MKNVLKPLDVFRGKSSDHGGGMERICKLITTMLASTWLWPIAIPQRLPSLNLKAAEFADKGYAVTDIDALTDAQRFAVANSVAASLELPICVRDDQ